MVEAFTSIVNDGFASIQTQALICKNSALCSAAIENIVSASVMEMGPSETLCSQQREL